VSSLTSLLQLARVLAMHFAGFRCVRAIAQTSHWLQMLGVLLTSQFGPLGRVSLPCFWMGSVVKFFVHYLLTLAVFSQLP
jgi:hypothetical protein